MNNLCKQCESLLLGFLGKIVAFDRTRKLALLLLMDGALCLLSVWIAFSLRLGAWDLWNPAIATVALTSFALWLLIFTNRGGYRSVMRFVGSRTMLSIVMSCLLMSLILSASFIVVQIKGVPRTIGFLQPMVFATLLVISRMFARYILLDLLNQRNFEGSPKRVLIFGAGSAGRQLAMSLTHEPGMILRGYIDDDLRLSGQHLDGVRVYPNKHLDILIERMEIDTVLLAVPGISQQERKKIVRGFAEIPVHVLTLPAIGALVDGSVSTDNLREIEVTELLGREPVPPNHMLLHRTIANRVVMVTGAGGSIGRRAPGAGAG